MEDVPELPSKEARIQRGHERLGRGKKTAEKVLPRGMKEGVACLQRFSSETDGLPGLESGKTTCLEELWRALKRYSITSPVRCLTQGQKMVTHKAHLRFQAAD